MADIIGSIGPTVEITEVRSLDGPSTTLNLSDANGRLHGRVQWLSAEVTEEFLSEIAHLCAVAFLASPQRSSPSAAS